MKTALAQLIGFFDGFVRLNNLPVIGSNLNITTPLTTALNTAGRDGVPVPLQLASTGEGVVVGRTTAVFNASTEKPLLDLNDNEIYSKLTHSSGVYTLSFFSNVAGVETAYTFANSTNIDCVFVYRFDIALLPPDFAISFPINDINVPLNTTNKARVFSEKLVVSLTNTVSNLTFTPNFDYNLFLIVNGKHENTFGNPAFSRTAKTITWNPANAGYSLLTTYDVVATYTTLD